MQPKNVQSRVKGFALCFDPKKLGYLWRAKGKNRSHMGLNLSVGFISLAKEPLAKLPMIAFSFRVFYLRNGHLTILCGKNPKNLSDSLL